MVFLSLYPACKIAGITFSLVTIDYFGRRPLLIWGGVGAAIGMGIIAVGDAVQIHQIAIAGMCFYILAFAGILNKNEK